jgi:hypothetical protein
LNFTELAIGRENIENNEKNRISTNLPRHKETILFYEKVNIEKEE